MSILNLGDSKDNGEVFIGDIAAGSDTPITEMIAISIRDSERVGGKGDDLGANISISVKYTDVFKNECAVGPVEYMVFANRQDGASGRTTKVVTKRIRVSGKDTKKG